MARNIDNLKDLSNTITSVVSRMLEVATSNTSSGQYYVGYDAVADLISFEDYDRFHDLIETELAGREEVLDLDVDADCFDINCGLAWCKNYELLPEENFEYGYEEVLSEPSMARFAEIGQKVMEQLVLSKDPAITVSADALKIKKEELDYVRSVTGYQDPYVKQPFQTAVNAIQITTDSYETLELKAGEYYDKGLNEHFPSGTVTKPYHRYGADPHPFYICTNEYGQTDDDFLQHYPGTKEIFDKVLSITGTDIPRSGAIIDGRPAILLSTECFYSTTRDNPAVEHARTAFLAGMLDKIFEGRGVKISYSIDSGYNERDDVSDELICIIPADGDPKLIHAFEKAYTEELAKIEALPFLQDPNWFKAQYEAILSHVQEALPKINHFAPWAKENQGCAATFGCQALGEYIGNFVQDWCQAELTNNRDKLASLAKRFDAANNEHTLISVAEPAMWHAESALSRRVTLYTAPATRTSPAEKFTLPIGQLDIILRSMGYFDANRVTLFMLSSDQSAAKEVKEIKDRLDKQTLDQRLEDAKRRRDAQNRVSEAPSKEKGREI